MPSSGKASAEAQEGQQVRGGRRGHAVLLHDLRVVLAAVLVVHDDAPVWRQTRVVGKRGGVDPKMASLLSTQGWQKNRPAGFVVLLAGAAHAALPSHTAPNLPIFF